MTNEQKTTRPTSLRTVMDEVFNSSLSASYGA